MDFLELENYKKTLKACNYAVSTQRAYLKKFRAFFLAHDGKVESLTNSEINRYITEQSVNPAQTTIIASAIRAYFSNCLDREIRTLKVIRKETTPVILTTTEILLFLEACDSLTSRTVFSMVYYLGLRRQEVLNLKITDISESTVTIRKSKGADRVINLPVHLKKLLDQFTATTEKHYKYLFDFSPSELRSLFIDTLKTAGINKPATLHSLRHSCATHLYNSGVDIIAIKNLLGHKSLNTTLIYIKFGAQGAELPELKRKEI